MTEVAANPFAGMKRKRLPGMHMITAIEGGVPLTDALAAFFFMMLHDSYPHTCLIEQAEVRVRSATDGAILRASDPDAAFMGSVLGTMANSSLAFQEWSYLSDDEIVSFRLMADVASEQTQRWIFEGVENPYKIPVGNLVDCPTWAAEWQSQGEGLESRQKAREYVKRLRAEIDE